MVALLNLDPHGWNCCPCQVLEHRISFRHWHLQYQLHVCCQILSIHFIQQHRECIKHCSCWNYQLWMYLGFYVEWEYHDQCEHHPHWSFMGGHEYLPSDGHLPVVLVANQQWTSQTLIFRYVCNGNACLASQNPYFPSSKWHACLASDLYRILHNVYHAHPYVWRSKGSNSCEIPRLLFQTTNSKLSYMLSRIAVSLNALGFTAYFVHCYWRDLEPVVTVPVIPTDTSSPVETQVEITIGSE